jgi:FAD/FMN-containing dehydrogenase
VDEFSRIAGGTPRVPGGHASDSVRGVEALEADGDVVAIHDAAGPS